MIVERGGRRCTLSSRDSERPILEARYSTKPKIARRGLMAGGGVGSSFAIRNFKSSTNMSEARNEIQVDGSGVGFLRSSGGARAGRGHPLSKIRARQRFDGDRARRSQGADRGREHVVSRRVEK